MSRLTLASTTILTGLAGFVLVSAASAADMSRPMAQPVVADAGALPAVDGFNSKFGLFGGSYNQGTLGGVSASVSFPLSFQFGSQTDVSVASIGDRFYGSVAEHLFWRDPHTGLLGVYGSYSHYDGYGGVDAYQLAVEAEKYIGKFTLRGIAGLEGGNAGTLINAANIQFNYSVDNRLFDKIDLAFYATDDFKLFGGHRYTGGIHAAALGGEYLWHVGGGTAVSLYAEGRIGENDYKAVWGGVKVYFGKTDKTLIQRNREDDPSEWEPDTLFGIGTGLDGTVGVCRTGYHIESGNCVSSPPP